MAVVVLRDVTKRFAGARDAAVDRVSFTVADGEFMALLGPSGCGKSTTLRMVAGLETLTTGTISIDDRVVDDVPAKDRDIAMVFQSYALYPHMTVRDNLAFGLRRRAVERAEIERRVREAAELLGLAELLERKPHALSGGQRQRVALGRAIVRSPKVFLFDEPLSNLDASLRASMRTEIARHHRRLGATMIYVTHDQVEAMTMSDRMCIMDRGRVMQVGAPLEVYRHPASIFVARFLGNPPMNLLPATLDADGGAPAARVGKLRIALEPATAARLAARPPGVVTLGIRPEHVYERPPPGIAAPAWAEFRVTVVEPLGAETLLTLALDDGPELIARVGGDSRAALGDTLRVALDPACVHLFDAESGASVG